MVNAALAQNVLDTDIDLKQVWVAFKDPKTWLMSYIIACIGMALAGFGAFLPTFIKEFGFDRREYRVPREKN
jgi:hypothetical protein